MARVLFLTQVLPYPLDAGPKVRAYYVLKHLSQRHEVTLVSFVRPDDPPESVRHLRTVCSRVAVVPMERSRRHDVRAVVRGLVTGAPVVIARDSIPAMYEQLRTMLSDQEYDIVHADQTSMAQYGLYARDLARKLSPNRVPGTVLDAHNALFRVFGQLGKQEHRGLWRLGMRREARALERYERSVWGKFDHTVFVSPADRLLAERGAEPDGRFGTIPICIDVADRAPVVQHGTPRLVTHLGTMFWPPNVDGVVWFAREVFPRVVQRVPEARLAVIGKRPPSNVLDLAHQPNIDVLGYVPDPVHYLEQTAAFVVPLRAGAGMRVKILDGWCWALPIVSTTLGADSIEAHDGQDLLIADEPEQFADAVVRLLKEPELRGRLGSAGRRWVTERYDWRVTYTHWDSIYDRLLDRAVT